MKGFGAVPSYSPVRVERWFRAWPPMPNFQGSRSFKTRKQVRMLKMTAQRGNVEVTGFKLSRIPSIKSGFGAESS